MSHETAVGLNQLGLLFGFASFWFVAPEFIGVHRLKKWELSLKVIVTKLPEGADQLFKFVVTTVCIWGTETISALAIKHSWPVGIQNRILIFIAFLLLAAMLAFLYAYFIKPILDRLVLRAVSFLATNNKQRQTLLFIGALFFIISFALQFLATLER